ncbi:MAG: CHASE2 domain-containing protein [Cyclobacteriaceae bacterium]
MRIFSNKLIVSLFSLVLIIALIVFSPLQKLLDISELIENNLFEFTEQGDFDSDITIISSANINKFEFNALVQSIRGMNPSTIAINLCGSSVPFSDSLVLAWTGQGIIVTSCEELPLSPSYNTSTQIVKEFNVLPSENSFELEILRNYNPNSLNALYNRGLNYELINFIIPTQNFEELNYESFLNGRTTKKKIESKIVLIGYLGEYMLDNEIDSIASYRTPLNRSLWRPDENKMYGIEITANIVQMILDSNFLDEFSDILRYSIFALIIGVCAFLLFRIPIIYFWIVGLILYFVLTFGELFFASYLLSTHNLIIGSTSFQIPFIFIALGIFVYKMIKAKRPEYNSH